jgi:glycosyltransferase involved in cell wall biosynthesis
MKRRKGFSVSVLLMKKVIESAPEAKYVIVTKKNKDPQYWGEVESLIKKYGMEEKIEIISDLKIEELRALYQGATAYLLMPQNVDWDVEGFGLSVIEACASGTPVVVKSGSGADDAFAPGNSGFLVGSEEEAAEKLIEILKNENGVRERLCDGAIEFAKEKSWVRQSKRYAEIYRLLFRNRSSGF